MHPLLDDISGLSDNEIDLKIADLSRKYFQTRNPDLQSQIVNILEVYKQEAVVRREKAKLRQQEENNGESGLDNLINVS